MRATGKQWIAEHCPIQGVKNDRSAGVRIDVLYKAKVKQSRYRPGVAQRVPGS
jgi:hypothetical protein